MDAKSVIKQVKEEKNEIRQVYWVACGGSLVDLYPAHCMVMAESALVESGLYTSKEFILATPKNWVSTALLYCAAIPAAQKRHWMRQSLVCQEARRLL